MTLFRAEWVDPQYYVNFGPKWKKLHFVHRRKQQLHTSMILSSLCGSFMIWRPLNVTNRSVKKLKNLCPVKGLLFSTREWCWITRFSEPFVSLRNRSVSMKITFPGRIELFYGFEVMKLQFNSDHSRDLISTRIEMHN